MDFITKKCYQSAVNKLILQADLTGEWEIKNSKANPWISFRPKDANRISQGWKIHISAVVVEAADMIESSLNLFLSKEFSFKIPTSQEHIIDLNSGVYGMSQVGKIITLYPNFTNDQQLIALVSTLREMWPTGNGPFVPSDLQVIPPSPIYMRYGSYNHNHIAISSKGFIVSEINNENGELIEDVRSSNSLPDFMTSLLQHSFQGQRRISTHGNEVIRIDEVNYLPVSTIHRSAKGRVLLCTSSKLGIYIIKEARRGTFCDLDGRDSQDRLRNEWEIISCLPDGIGPSPVAFEHGQDMSVAVYHDADGVPLTSLPADRALALLPKVAEALDRLHNENVVHRDLKPTNILVSQERVILIDFEISIDLNRRLQPFRGGTTGYIAPEGNIDKHSDIYALGMCMAYFVLGIDPGFIDSRGRLIALMHEVASEVCCDIFSTLTALNPNERPKSSEVMRIFDTFRSTLDFHRPQNSSTKCQQKAERLWCLRAATDSGFYTREYLQQTRQGITWSNTHHCRDYLAPGFNIGASGIVFGLATLEECMARRFCTIETMENCISWLTTNGYKYHTAGLFTGTSGLALALSVASKRYNLDLPSGYVEDLLEKGVSYTSHFDFFNGLSGYIYACCLISTLNEEDWPLALAEEAAVHVLNNVREYHQLLVWPETQGSNDSNHKYLLGAAHGTAGIALCLLTLAKLTGNHRCLALGNEVFERLHSYFTIHGNYKSVTRDNGASNSFASRQWCHGCMGYLWCAINGLEFNTLCQEILQWGLEEVCQSTSLGNATYCHGLAGELEFWRLLQGSSEHSQLAENQMYATIRKLRILSYRKQNMITWMSDIQGSFTPDLWVGFLGPATSLAMCLAGRKESILSLAWIRECIGGNKMC